MRRDEAEARAATLNRRFRNHSATDVLRAALREGALGPHALGRVAMVSSFGAESVALLHMLSRIAPATPVLFLDTHKLFRETLDYQMAVAKRLRLSDVRRLGPNGAEVARLDPHGTLHRTDPDGCCAIRKTLPLARALAGFDTWITGRKRYQGATRAALDFFEVEGLANDEARLKVNPLAHWRKADVADYADANGLLRHPLVAQGYPSIGCEPCTSRVWAGEDERAGRWRGRAKSECGIHIVDGRVVRGPAPEPALAPIESLPDVA